MSIGCIERSVALESCVGRTVDADPFEAGIFAHAAFGPAAPWSLCLV